MNDFYAVRILNKIFKMHINLCQSSLIIGILRVSDGLLCFLDEVCRLVHDVACMVDDGVLEVAIVTGRRDAAYSARQHMQRVRRVACCNPRVVLIAL